MFSYSCRSVRLKCNSSDFVKDDYVFLSMLTKQHMDINVGKGIRCLLCHLLASVVCAFVFAVFPLCARHYYYCTSEINFPFLSVNGQDFTSPAMPTVVFNTGADNGDTVCTSITIIDDNDFEGDHSFTANIDSISPSTIDIVLSTTAAEIVIEDDQGEINFCDV